MLRTLLSPAKTPAVVMDLPVESVVVLTAVWAAMRTKAELSELTSPPATALICASSRATVIVTGSADTADAVTVTPGSRSANLLVEEVMTCSAEVPFQSETLAS